MFSKMQRNNIIYHYQNGHSAEEIASWSAYRFYNKEDVQACIDSYKEEEVTVAEAGVVPYVDKHLLAEALFSDRDYYCTKEDLLDDLMTYIKINLQGG